MISRMNLISRNDVGKVAPIRFVLGFLMACAYLQLSLHRFDVRHGFRQRAYQSKRAADVGKPLTEISPFAQRVPRPNACEARSDPFP